MADVKSTAADEHGLPTNPLRPAGRAIGEWFPVERLPVTGQPECSPDPLAPRPFGGALNIEPELNAPAR